MVNRIQTEDTPVLVVKTDLKNQMSVLKMMYNVTFSIPHCKIIDDHDHQAKTKFLSDLIPGRRETYVYNTEEEYYNEKKDFKSFPPTPSQKGRRN